MINEQVSPPREVSLEISQEVLSEFPCKALPKTPGSAELLKKAYEELKASNAHSAYTLLEEALDLDFENEEVKHALKCVHWWLIHTRRIDDIKNLFEKGSCLVSLLKPYHAFVKQLNKQINENYEQCQYVVRFFVYSKALFFFDELLKTGAYKYDPELLLLVGRCYKGTGNYDEALVYLEQAVRIKKDDAEILAEAADINALLSQAKTAKALFREAFFIDPSKVDIRYLESAFILKLCDKVSQMGYRDEELCEWIPVYAHLWGVFTVKRELKQTEVGRLKQSIFSLEAEYESNPARKGLLKPRLLNQYFRLIDYYEINREDSSLVEETLLKIKVTDPDIYSMYVG